MLRLAAALGLLILISSCGKVSVPLPPFIRIPQGIQDLSATQNGDTIVLAWTNPALNIDGSLATDLAFVHISVDGKVIEPIAPTGAGRPQSHLVPVQNSIGTNRAFAVWLQTAREKVSVVANASITPVEVPGAVNGLSAAVDQYTLTVTWQPPEQNRNLAESYFVSRLDRQVPPAITQELQFKDSAFERGQEYTYEVVAARRAGANWIPGLRAAPVQVRAVDVAPPRVPSGIQVVVSDSGAYVTWNANEELDLAGYRLFRNGNPVSPALLTGNSFFDTEYRPGVLYSVSATDEFGNESPRSAPVR